jgi:hypothetical protein
MKYILGVYMLLIASMAYASCTTNSVFVGGKLTVCTTCCTSGNCNTTCV